MRCSGLALVALVLTSCSGRETDPAPAGPPMPPLEPPTTGIADEDAAIELPPAPPLELSPTPPGETSIRELRVRSSDLFGQEVRVRGSVVWIYDCAENLRAQGLSERRVERALRREPERCQAPHFALAPEADDAPEAGILVVDVPSEPTPDERRVLPEETLEAWPEVPTLAVGDEVIVAGTWDETSPQGFRDTRGLLIYGELEPAP